MYRTCAGNELDLLQVSLKYVPQVLILLKDKTKVVSMDEQTNNQMVHPFPETLSDGGMEQKMAQLHGRLVLRGIQTAQEKGSWESHC